MLAGEQRLTAPAIARIVRESDQTVRTWLKRWLAEGIEGLKDRPMPGGPTKLTADYREWLLAAVRQRPRSLGRPSSLRTLQRLADYLAELTGVRLTSETVRTLRQRCESPARPDLACNLPRFPQLRQRVACERSAR